MFTPTGDDVRTLVQSDPLFAARLEVVMLRRVIAEMEKACEAHDKHDCSGCSNSCHCRDAG